MANSEYLIRVYNPFSGMLSVIIDDWRTLSYTKKLNDIGDLQLGLDYRNGRIPNLISTDSIIEVWRRNQPAGLDWYVDETFLARTPQYEETERGNDIYTVYARSLNDLLNRRSVLYLGQTSLSFTPYVSNPYTNKIGPADDIMRSFVRENFTADANNLHRLRAGEMPGIVVGDDTGQAPYWQGQRSMLSVLKVLQDIATSHNIDFKMLWTERQPVQFTFVAFYPNQGRDLTIGNAQGLAPVIIADAYASMNKASYTVSRTDEANAVVILVPGVDEFKTAFVYQSDARFDSPFNDIEYVYEDRDIPSGFTNDQKSAAAALSGARILNEQKAKESFQFTALQSAQFVYGRDYNLGDTCSVQYKGITRSKRLVQATIGVSEGKEELDLEFADYLPSPTNQYDILRAIANRIQQLGVVQYELQYGSVGGLQ